MSSTAWYEDRGLVLLASFRDEQWRKLELVRVIGKAGWWNVALAADPKNEEIRTAIDRFAQIYDRFLSADEHYMIGFAIITHHPFGDDWTTVDALLLEMTKGATVYEAFHTLKARLSSPGVCPKIWGWLLLELLGLDRMDDVFESAAVSLSLPILVDEVGVTERMLEQLKGDGYYSKAHQALLEFDPRDWDSGDDDWNPRINQDALLGYGKRLVEQLHEQDFIGVIFNDGLLKEQEEWKNERGFFFHVGDAFNLAGSTVFGLIYLIDEKVWQLRMPFQARAVASATTLPDLLQKAAIYVEDDKLDAWLDENILEPEHVALPIDPEPYELLDEATPYSWPDEKFELTRQAVLRWT